MLRAASVPPDQSAMFPTPSPKEQVPIVARVAGLPISAVTRLRGEATLAALTELTAVEEATTTLRQVVAEELYRAVPKIDPTLRRQVLRLKRDCFNGRPLKALDNEIINALRPWSDDRLRQLLFLEEQLVVYRDALQRSYAEDRERSRRHLLKQCEDTDFRRGLTLASQLAERGVGRLSEVTYDTYGRRERRAEQSLARYVTRAAVKLSPFSTFTKIALGLAQPGSQCSPLKWVQEMKPERSLVRLQTYIPAQWVALLCFLPAVRETLAVRLNPTLESLPNGHFTFQRPMMLEHNPKQRSLMFRKPSVAKLKLGGSLFDLLAPRLATRPKPFVTLSAELAAESQTDIVSIRKALHQLLDLMLLEVVPPWPSYFPRLEEAVLHLFDSNELGVALEARPALRHVKESLRRLVEAEVGFAKASSPQKSLSIICTEARSIFETLRDEVEPAANLSFEMDDQDIYEDVLQQGRTCSGLGEVVRFDSSTARDILYQVQNLWRIRGLFEQRHECLHALWHRISDSARIGEQIPFLEFFRENREIWQSYVEHSFEERNSLFDPYELDSIRILKDLRQEILDKLGHSLRVTEHGFEVPQEVLSSAAANIPERYLSPLDACAIVQPTDAEYLQWVAHHITVGNGRFSCRYNSLLAPSARDWFVTHFKQFSEWGKDTSRGLDLYYTRPTPIGAHWPQTRSVLELPGEFYGPDVEHLLSPQDLFVEGRTNEDLRVVDCAGNSYLPALLSVLKYTWIPPFIKFLTLFGLDSRACFDIPYPTEQRDGLLISPRLSTGSLTFRRRRWEGPARLFVDNGVEDEAASFACLWRRSRELGLPQQVFWIEKLSRTGEPLLCKPQFLDFSSPTLVSIFVQALNNGAPDDMVTLEEALPEPGVFDSGPHSTGRAIELILEGLAFI